MFLNPAPLHKDQGEWWRYSPTSRSDRIIPGRLVLALSNALSVAKIELEMMRKEAVVEYFKVIARPRGTDEIYRNPHQDKRPKRWDLSSGPPDQDVQC
jgi:hypothetical protein